MTTFSPNPIVSGVKTPSTARSAAAPSTPVDMNVATRIRHRRMVAAQWRRMIIGPGVADCQRALATGRSSCIVDLLSGLSLFEEKRPASKRSVGKLSWLTHRQLATERLSRDTGDRVFRSHLPRARDTRLFEAPGSLKPRPSGSNEDVPRGMILVVTKKFRSLYLRRSCVDAAASAPS